MGGGGEGGGGGFGGEEAPRRCSRLCPQGHGGNRVPHPPPHDLLEPRADEDEADERKICYHKNRRYDDASRSSGHPVMLGRRGVSGWIPTATADADSPTDCASMSSKNSTNWEGGGRGGWGVGSFDRHAWRGRLVGAGGGAAALGGCGGRGACDCGQTTLRQDTGVRCGVRTGEMFDLVLPTTFLKDLPRFGPHLGR